MIKQMKYLTIIIVLFMSGIVNGQMINARENSHFALEKSVGLEATDYHICLKDYYVMEDGQKKSIPIFPIYSDLDFFYSKEARGIDALERASNALDAVLYNEKLEVHPAPHKGIIDGYSIWAVPDCCDPECCGGNDENKNECNNRQLEHSSMVFTIGKEEKSRFGSWAKDEEEVADYVMELFKVFQMLFVRFEKPTGEIMNLPEVSVLMRVYLDALQYARDNTGLSVITAGDIQYALNMMSQDQRLRVRGLALIVPPKGDE